MHRFAVPQLCHSRHLPPCPRSLEHQARPLLAWSDRSLFELRAPRVDTLYADHVLISIRKAGCCEQHELYVLDLLWRCSLLTDYIDVCVVYAVVATLTALDWIFRGRKSFRGVGERKAGISGHTHTIVDVPQQDKY